MNIRLGYATGIFHFYDISLKEKIRSILEVQDDAIELGFVRSERLNEYFDDEVFELVKKFKYRSIHAPTVGVTYPSKEAESIIEKVVFIAEKIEADTVLFHPDVIKNFDWINEKLGDLLSFENMDSKKSYGKSIKDLEDIFTRSPQAKWVFDVNHLYTINKSMDQAEYYRERFGSRLCHYHLSGYGGFHTCLSVSKEDIILKGITDFSKPIIHEGAVKNMKDIIKDEHQYILERLTGRS